MAMMTDKDPSPEGDWLDQTPETAMPDRPMIVIHYRNRGVPVWASVVLIFLVPIGGLLAYRRFAVEADHAEVVVAARVDPGKIVGERSDAPVGIAVQPPVDSKPLPSALASMATASQPSPASPNLAAANAKSPTLAATSPTNQAVVAPLPASPGGTEPTSEDRPVPRSKPDGPVVADATGSPDSARDAQPVESVASPPHARSEPGAAVAIAKPSATAKAMTSKPATATGDAWKTASNRSIATEDPSKTKGPRPLDDPGQLDEPLARNDQEVRPISNPRANPDTSRPAVANDPAPNVPEKKSMRPIREAAVADGTDRESREYEERAKFRKALKDALSLNTRQAGADIDQLSRQDRSGLDPQKLAEARRAWSAIRLPLPTRLRQIRSLGVSESVILDFISADLRPLIGSRSGPRDLNDARVRAAKLLLTHDLPAPASMIAAARPAAPPDEPAASEPASIGGTWPFRSGRDAFRADALLNLRGLNEKVAGQSGFVRLSPDGESFVLGDGTPVRFWGVSSGGNRGDIIVDEAAHHARFLAKRGVNMVRWYRALHSKAKNSRITDTDPKAIDATWRFVAAMKKEGIYVTYMPYWYSSAQPVPASWGLEGWPAKESPSGLLFFDRRLQQGYKAWLKAQLTRPNPYTGIPLANEPAVAIIELQNEDSLLFYTAQNIKGKEAELLGRQFGDWLKAKYGTLDDAFRAWGNDRVKDDRPDQGVVGLLLVWEWTQQRQGGRKKRLDDQLQFYSETMYNFNREIERYLHEELGCKQLVNANNWRSVDAIKVGDAERWTYTANEVLAANRYYNPIHIGPTRGWRINAGDTFEDVSVLFRPRELPLNLKQAVGHPMMITETHWVPPLGYQSEGPFLVAAYQSLNGVDLVDWSSSSEPEWSDQDRSEWDSPSRAKWEVATPMVLGQFPAAALLFRKGYLKQGPPAIEEHRSLRQIWERVPPIIAEDPAYDPNRDLGDSARRSGQSGTVDPLAFLVGPVVVNYDSEPSKTTVADLRPFIDRDRKVVRSNTGQVSLDYGRGLCTIDAPQAQGACGFLKSCGPVELSSVSLRSENPYASVLIVSMDGEILSRSRRVLVQVGTRARPTGWVERGARFSADNGRRTIDGKQIVSLGRMPWAVEDTSMTLEVKNPGLKRATSLDPNGEARSPVAVVSSGQTLTVKLPRGALYVVLDSE
jgi:hypothetical protein